MWVMIQIPVDIAKESDLLHEACCNIRKNLTNNKNMCIFMHKDMEPTDQDPVVLERLVLRAQWDNNTHQEHYQATAYVYKKWCK